MLFQKLNPQSVSDRVDFPVIAFTPDLNRICRLNDADRDEVRAFLNVRPVHTVVIGGFISDHGMQSPLNRGTFFGYRSKSGQLEGVALLGHSTLIEARTDEAMMAFALTAKLERIPIHLIMSEHDEALKFWQHYAGNAQPRLTCTELLFETVFPMLVRECEWEVRPARADEIEQIAAAHAEVAFIETGVDPLAGDRKGFLSRVARRIDRQRVFVVVENGKLIFKADIIAESDGIIYLEGIYVSPEMRGKGVGPQCLSRLNQILLRRSERICMLSNQGFTHAHRSFQKAGYRVTGRTTTLFT